MTTVSSSAAVSSSGTRSYVTSTASGLDTDALIETAVAQKTQRADTLDARVSANEEKISAYQEVQDLVGAIVDAMAELALPEYSSLGSENAFDSRSGSLSTASGDSVSALAVDVDSTAQTGEYELEVVQLAQAMKVAAPGAESSTALGLDGVLRVGAEGESAVDIEVTADMTLSDLSRAINDRSSETGVQSSLIKLDDNSYQLVLSAIDTNAVIEITAVSGDDVAQSIGLTASDGSFTNVLREAQPSIITIDGSTVTRSTNELTDVIEGLSISLSAVSDEPITLKVQSDSSAVKTAITDFVEAYNALKQYVLDQQATADGGGAAEDAVLFADSLLRSLDEQLKTLINSASPSSSDGVSRLSDIGITWTEDAMLEVTDESALNDAILSNLEGVEALFETRYETSNDGLKLLRNETTRSFDFTLSVTTDGSGAITSVSADGDSAAFTVSGSRLIGAEGTIYEGLTLTLSPASSGDISVSIQQGFANLLVETLKAYGTDSDSLIEQRIQSLETLNDDLTTRSDRIRDQAEAYRERLVNKYANMEAELEAAKLLQAQIEALLGSDDSDD